MDSRTAEVTQTVLAVVGIAAGAIPLVRVLFFDGGAGIWLSWIPGTDSSPGEWLVPLVVSLVTFGAILAVDRAKR